MGEGNGLDTLKTGMAQSLLQEIADRLSDLAKTGETSAIDLRSLPMTPADRDELEERLGRGDVEATLDVAGKSEVRETHYPGVWWVRHFGTGDAVASERIEITAVPEILVTHAADIAAGSKRLREALSAHSAEPMQHASEEAPHA
jgi:hydrogenase-1 operon protein HyaF